jgi:DNA uptake protein ComE-like DNA-binding protein
MELEILPVAVIGFPEENMGVNRRALLSTLGSLLFAAAAGLPQEDYEHAGGRSESAVPESARVDINRASVDELMKVPGMTRTWAQRIVKYRPYNSKADLLEQGVVTGEIYKRIRDYLIAHRVEKKG